MTDNKNYWSNQSSHSVKTSIANQINGTSLVDPTLKQQQQKPTNNRPQRSHTHLASSIDHNGNSRAYGNQNINYIQMSNSDRNSTENFFSLNEPNRNSRVSIISSSPIGTYYSSRNGSRNGSRYNLESNSGINCYYSYDHYVNDKCSKNKKSESPDACYEITQANIEKFHKVKDEDLNIDNSKWLEEKPISVLQLDQPDRAVLKIAGKCHVQWRSVIYKFYDHSLS